MTPELGGRGEAGCKWGGIFMNDFPSAAKIFIHEFRCGSLWPRAQSPTPPTPRPDPRATSDLWNETILYGTLIQAPVAVELDHGFKSETEKR